jgi:hypothetical protein
MIPSILFFVLVSVVSVVAYIIKNPEKLDKWIYLVSKYTLWKNERTERKIISSNLDYKVSTITKMVNKEAEGIIPFGLRIKWTNIESDDAFVQNGNVIIVLKKEDNNDKNIVRACTAFVPKALLPKSRNSIDITLLNSLDKYFIKRILSQGNYDSAYNYFMQNIFTPFCAESEDNLSLLSTYSKLDDIGFLTRILLEEFRRVGAKLYGTMDEPRFLDESRAFFQFLKAFTERHPGDLTKLYFDGQMVKLAIILIAKRATLEHQGVVSYVNRLRKQVTEFGLNRVFVFSYSQRYDEVIEDDSGYVVGIRKRNEFVNLNSFEMLCKSETCVRLIKKQNYLSTDVAGNRRKSRYLLYEAIR